MSKNIAITGATGFVGRHLLRHCLQEGWKVRILTRDQRKARQMPAEIEVFSGDLVDDKLDLSEFLSGQDVLVHCAGEIKDEARMRELHIEGCKRLIAAAARRVPHWVQLSSVGVYGRPRKGTVTEESVQAPVGTYEKTKAESDVLVLSAAKGGAFDCTILRPSTVYAPDMPNESLRSLIRSIGNGTFFFIGNTGAQAVYIHVDDVVAAIVACINDPRARNQAYNVSDQCSFEELTRIVCEVSNRPDIRKRLPVILARMIATVGEKLPGFPLTHSRVDALTTQITYDTSKIMEELKIRPRITFLQGMREMVLGMGSQRKE